MNFKLINAPVYHANIMENYSIWNDKTRWQDEGYEWDPEEGFDSQWENTIYPMISSYIKNKTLEIGPGYGRVTGKLLNEVENITLIDICDHCLAFCKEKFGNKITNYYEGDGYTLDPIQSNTIGFIISWDCFVHIHEKVTASYLKEMYRVLEKGGTAFIHHSHLGGGSDHFIRNIAGRTNMTLDKFKELSGKEGFKTLHQTYLQKSPTLVDGLSLIQKV